MQGFAAAAGSVRLNVRFAGKTIQENKMALSVAEANRFFSEIRFAENDEPVGEPPGGEIFANAFRSWKKWGPIT